MHRQYSVHIARMRVDTGSEATWVPQQKLAEAKVKPEKRQPFQMPNGQIIYRDVVGYALIQVADRETTDEVVFAEAGDYAILGARTLERLRLWVDPSGKKLIKLVTQPVAKVIVPGKVPPDKDRPPPILAVVIQGKGGPPPQVPRGGNIPSRQKPNLTGKLRNHLPKRRSGNSRAQCPPLKK